MALSTKKKDNIDSSQISTLMLSNEILKDNNELRLILASKSARRAEILDMMGLRAKYEIIPSPLNEEELQTELKSKEITPEEYVKILAEKKAMALIEETLLQSKQVGESKTIVILGSDTIVDFQGAILEKPRDEEDAMQTLKMLSGQWHLVHTGVSILKIKNKKKVVENVSFYETSQVKFCELSDKDIQAYVNSGEPMDKAGSYGIQGSGGQMVEQIKGDYFTIMGLPMHRVSKELCRILFDKE